MHAATAGKHCVLCCTLRPETEPNQPTKELGQYAQHGEHPHNLQKFEPVATRRDLSSLAHHLGQWTKHPPDAYATTKL
jgi:hypothetical protein